MQLNVQKSVIRLGIPKPIRLLHITDTHVHLGTGAEGDTERKNTEAFEAAVSYAKENGLRILHTGDIINTITRQNLDYVTRQLSGVECLLMSGNHDLCLPGNIGLDDASFRWEHLKQIAPYFPHNLYVDSCIINGVNFVMLQDIYYDITRGQIDMLRAEAAKGYPIILCLHIPLFDSNKADMMLKKNRPCGYMVATPEHYYTRYNEHYRMQQTPSPETLEAVRCIGQEPMIKAIIAGHTHENFDGVADCGKRQITTAATMNGFVREIVIE